MNLSNVNKINVSQFMFRETMTTDQIEALSNNQVSHCKEWQSCATWGHALMQRMTPTSDVWIRIDSDFDTSG